jgi:hypothetical protein
VDALPLTVSVVIDTLPAGVGVESGALVVTGGEEVDAAETEPAPPVPWVIEAPRAEGLADDESRSNAPTGSDAGKTTAVGV